MVTLVSVSPCLVALTTSWPLSHFAEDGVFAVEPIGHDVGDEELAAVGAGAGVGHRERSDLVLVRIAFELVFEAIAGAAAAGAGGVAALDHEVGDDAVEDGAVVEFVAGQEDEVVDGLGRFLGEQLADDFAARSGESRGVFLVRSRSPSRAGWDIVWTFASV